MSTLLLGVLLAAGTGTAVAVTSANARSPLGINLESISFYSTEQPFLNVFVTNGGWVTHSQDTWDTHEEQYLQLDANGYPKTLVAAPSDPHSQLFDSVGIIVDRVPVPYLYPAGRYVVLYDGEGTMTYEFDARLISSSRGRDVIEVARPSDNNGIHLQITETDPRHNGNYIRNIRIVRQQDEAAFRAGQLFDPAFLQMLSRFRALRFMDWLNTNGSTLSSWSARPVPSYYSWTTGVPLEVAVALANAVSADAWLNVPAMADDDYVRQMAALVHGRLGPTQKVYLEYSNEVWNNSFPQYDYAVRRGKEAWPNRPSGDNGYEWNRNWYGMRSAQICDMWKAAWGPDRNRVICVLAAQAAYGTSATEALDCPYWAGAPCSGHGIGAIAIAPYFGDRNLPSQWVTQPDGGLTRLFASLTAGGDPGVPDGGWFHETAQWETSYAAIGAHYHLPLIGYEGGQGFISGSRDPAARLLVAANRDPRMGAAYTQYLQQWKGNGGELLVLYNDIGSFSQYGEWGALESLMQWKTSAARPPPKWAAIQGFIGSTPCWWPQCTQ
ncbi:MAG TPA: hypothetical protein VIY50_07930 [Steroidobacteraceae bacterium]